MSAGFKCWATYQRSCISTRATNRFKSFSSVLASNCARILCVFAEAVVLMLRRSRSMQQRLVSSLVSTARCHVYTCHILRCDRAGAAAQSSGAFAERLRVARDTHHNPRALSSVCRVMYLISREPAALQRCRLSPLPLVCVAPAARDCAAVCCSRLCRVCP